MIRPMTDGERKRAMERNAINSSQRAKREDGLVKRLRNGDEFEKVMSAGQAADRIEQLAATNEELSNCVAVLEQQLRISETIREAVSEGRDRTFARMQARIEELEAKLAKAVAILRDAERLCADGHPVSALNLARATLAELKGEDRG